MTIAFMLDGYEYIVEEKVYNKMQEQQAEVERLRKDIELLKASRKSLLSELEQYKGMRSKIEKKIEYYKKCQTESTIAKIFDSDLPIFKGEIKELEWVLKGDDK
jgi:hypothetical protein